MCNIRIKYIVLISLVGVFFLAELIVGIVANSITLQTDAFHMLSDLVALIIGFIALLVLDRRHHRYTYGWARAEIIAGLINSVFLLAIGFMLVIENIEKYIELSEDTSNDDLENNIVLVLIVACGGLLVNIIGIGLFHNEHTHSHSHAHGDPEEESEETQVRNYAQAAVLLHIIGDTLGSVLVIINSVIIMTVDGDWKFYLDPTGSMLIVVFIVISSSRLLWQCVRILMHRWSGSPAVDIKSDLVGVEGVETVHEFHVWSLDNKVAVASMHVKMQPDVSSDKVDGVLTAVKDVLHRRGIHSSTIQPEWGEECIEPTCRSTCAERQCCKDT
jgi:zinc transporter 1